MIITSDHLDQLEIMKDDASGIALLKAILNQLTEMNVGDCLEVSIVHKRAAGELLDFVDDVVNRLETTKSVRSYAEAPAGHYKRVETDNERILIEWTMPRGMEMPIFTYEIHCPYCDREVSISRPHPAPPQTCLEPECVAARRRELARARKRRQRANRK